MRKEARPGDAGQNQPQNSSRPGVTTPGPIAARGHSKNQQENSAHRPDTGAQDTLIA